MTTIVFLGPSLPRQEAARVLPDAQWWPPAQAGDVYRAVEHHGATTIGLVDGLFGTAPSVWHKEILFALSRGVRVFGSSSMGALRAAECAPFGMRGVGGIYRAYASGELVDDDEVAVAHLDAAQGFEAVTVPMVTVRRIVEVARDEGMLTADAAQRIAVRCKEIFYADRSWEAFGVVLEECLDEAAAASVRSLARSGRADPKADDARELLQVLAGPERAGGSADHGEDRPPPVVMEDTAFFRRLRHEIDLPTVTPWFDDPGGGVEVADRVDIVRGALLDPGHADLGIQSRLWVKLVEDSCEQFGIVASTAEVQRKSELRRRELGLLDAAATRAWLAERGLSAAEWRRSLEFEVKVDHLIDEFAAELRSHIPRLVAARGGWRQYAALAGSPGEPAGWDEHTAQVSTLIRSGTLPPAADMDSLVARLGFTSLTELLSTLDRHRPSDAAVAEDAR